jgi:hypothetical protein
MIKAFHNLARKAGGISIAFQLAKIDIAKHWMHRMAARYDTLVLAYTRSIMT